MEGAKPTIKAEQNLFSLALKLMALQGISSPTNKSQRVIAFFLKYYLLYTSVHFVIICILGVLLGENPYHLKLETISGMVAGMSMVYRHFILAFNRKEIMRLINRINVLADKVVSVYGVETTTPWTNVCYVIMVVSACIVTFTTLPAYSYSYYRFYKDGVVIAPYEVYMPFERDGDHIHHVIVFQLLSFLDQCLTLIVSNTLIGTVVVVISGITKIIADRYEGINRRNVHMLRDTIDWHSEVIMIVEDTNALFGSAMMVDCLLSIVHISVSGYLLVKVGFENGKDLHKYIFLNLLCVTIPSYFCFCGHVISLGREKLHNAVYQNDWYKLSLIDRKHLILPARMANRGLSLHFRKAVEFNLPTYLSIIKQSYSFIAVLKLMDA